jgi:hypothetical protein
MADAAAEGTSEALSVRVTWTAEDATAYTDFMSAAQVVGQDVPTLWRTWSLRIGAAAAVGAMGLWRTGSAETAAILSTITFFAVYYAPDLYTKDWTSKQAHAETMKRDPAPYEDNVVIISPAGVTQHASALSTTMRWSGIQDITMAKGVLVLWSSRASGVAIPVRCFASDRDAAAFMDQARRWRQAAAEPANPG